MSDNKNLNKDFLTKYPTDFNRRAIEKDFNELLNVSLTRTRYNQSYKMCGLDCDFVSLEGRYSKPVCTIPADYVHLYAFGVYLNHSNPYKTRKDADVIKKVAIENDLNLNVKTNDYKQYTYLNAYMNHLRKIIDQMPFYAKNAVVSSPEHKYQRIIHQVMPSIIEKLSLIMYLFLAIPKENCEYPDMNSLHYLNSVLSDVINGYIAKTNPKGKIDFSKMNYWDFNREYLKENMYSNYSCRFPPNYAGNSQLEDICKQVNSYLDDTSNKLNIDCKQLRNAYLEYLADNETDLDKEKKRQNVEFDTECSKITIEPEVNYEEMRNDQLKWLLSAFHGINTYPLMFKTLQHFNEYDRIFMGSIFGDFTLMMKYINKEIQIDMNSCLSDLVTMAIKKPNELNTEIVQHILGHVVLLLTNMIRLSTETQYSHRCFGNLNLDSMEKSEYIEAIEWLNENDLLIHINQVDHISNISFSSAYEIYSMLVVRKDLQGIIAFDECDICTTVLFYVNNISIILDVFEYKIASLVYDKYDEQIRKVKVNTDMLKETMKNDDSFSIIRKALDEAFYKVFNPSIGTK